MAASKLIKELVEKGVDALSNLRKPIVGTRAQRARNARVAKKRPHPLLSVPSSRDGGQRVRSWRPTTKDISNERVREIAQKDQASLQADRNVAAGALRRARGRQDKMKWDGISLPPTRSRRGRVHVRGAQTRELAVDPFTDGGVPRAPQRVRDLISPLKSRAQRRVDRATGRNAPQRKIGRGRSVDVTRRG